MDDVVAGAQSLVTFATSALTLSTGLQKLVSGTKAEADVSKLHGVLVSTHQNALVAIRDQMALEREKVQLERKLEAFDRWDNEAAKYVLSSVGDGIVAFRLKSEANNREPSHLLCPNCFEQRRKSYIQRTATTKWSNAIDAHVHVHICHGCSSHFEFGIAFRPQSPERVADYDPYDD